jgi:phosphoglycerol transferase MdoB-like AlkP superfamily enzyme
VARVSFPRDLSTPYLVAWAPAALAALDLQRRLLAAGGYAIVARQLGEASLTIWQKLALFRADLVLVLGLVPAALLLVLGFLPSRRRGLVTAALGLAVLSITFVQARAFEAAGGFVSLYFVGKGLSWAGEQQGFLGQYVDWTDVAWVALLAVLTVAAALWAGRVERRNDAPGRTRLATSMVAVLVVCSLAPWMLPLGRTSCQGSALLHAVTTLAAGSVRRDGLPPRLSEAAAAESARAGEGAIGRTKDPAFFERARDADLVVVVLETTPSRVLAIDGDLSDLPNLRRLRDRSLVLANHFTTYPYTSFAIFSILTSCYPTDRYGPLARPFDGRRLPGIMASLGGRGYRTALYAPTPLRFGGDSAMYTALGIERQMVPGPPVADSAPPGWRATMARDGAAFDLLLGDVDGWIKRRQRYAAIFLPELGHAPWPDISPDLSVPEPVDRARRLARVEDQWLGELMALLERGGRLDSTLIVVVGDHGVRTREEDPAFERGKIDAYSFQVPALIYAPQVLKAPRVVSALTSHVDLQPTLLDLLGIDEGRGLEEGSPVWDPGLATRTTFFFARYYLGADGFSRGGRSFMWNYARGAGYATSGALAFPDSTVVRPESADDRMIRSTLESGSALSRRWLAALRPGPAAGPAQPR